MAEVSDFTVGTGARVIVKDDAYAGLSDEEMAQRWRRVDELAMELAVNNEIRRLKRETGKQADN